MPFVRSQSGKVYKLDEADLAKFEVKPEDVPAEVRGGCGGPGPGPGPARGGPAPSPVQIIVNVPSGGGMPSIQTGGPDKDVSGHGPFGYESWMVWYGSYWWYIWQM